MFIRDLRIALRSLLRQPTFLLFAAATLALGIGASTSIFSVLNGIVLRPLPYARPDEVVRVWNRWEGQPEADLSPAEHFDFLDQQRSFLEFGTYGYGSENLTGGNAPEQIDAAYLSPGVLEALGIAPGVGRMFTEEEHTAGGPPAVILSDGLWRRRFGGSRDVVGREIRLSGQAVQVIGVMPPGFELPESLMGAEGADILLPLGLDASAVSMRGSHFLRSVARLRPGVSVAAGSADVARIAGDMVARYPDDYPDGMGFNAFAEPIEEVVVGEVRSTLLILLGAVGLVLLIACVNVSSLLLIRSEQRRQEMGVCLALGAGRGQLVRQLAAESLILAFVGGVGGLLLASVATEGLLALRPPDLPRIDDVVIDFRVVAFALGVSALTALVFGLVPALQATRAHLQTIFREESGGNSSTGARFRLRNGFVVAEIALAVAITLGAGLLVRSSLALQRVDPGYSTRGVLTMRVALPESDYPSERVPDAFGQITDRLLALPGVSAAGAVTNLPLATSLGDLDFDIETRPTPDGAVGNAADWQTVTPGYFDAMGMRLVRGRGIEPTDREDAPGAVVINEAMASRFWPDEDPIGQRFLLGAGAGPGWVTVVGIVHDIRHASLREVARPEMYLPHAQFRTWGSGDPVRTLTLALRTNGDPLLLAAAARAALADFDPELPASAIQTMDSVRAGSLAETRFTTLLLSSFALIALLLAAIGVYGAQAYAVSRRTREIGIRMAIGARTTDLVHRMVSQGLGVAAVGLGIGVVFGLVATRVLGAAVYGVSTADPLTFLAVPLLLLGVAFAANWLPARRAAGIDPMRALRL